MLRRLKCLFLALIALFGRSAAQVPVSPDEHRSLAIYQIMVASFQHSPNGAEGYAAMWGPDGHTKSGNIKGITEALDHIASLGVNAIWLTPVFDSSNAFGGEKLNATGYYTNNFFAIDPHFGTEADFREMIDQAHARGLYVLLDGVFGHHGGVTTPSPSGFAIDTTRCYSVRGEQGGQGNVKYPGSLNYMRELATYYIKEYGIDGWRLDQAYQAVQGGHNYWLEIRAAVEDAANQRREAGEQWGTLGYLVGEDWGTPDVINNGVYSQGGLLSAFDFDGKERISGPMQQEGEILPNGWDDIVAVMSSPTSRGYLSDNVLPNLFLSNHDGFRVADHIDADDPHFYGKLKTLNAILAAYSGPVTLYYGDEYADITRNTSGGQKDNVARTSGHLNARNADEQDLKDYISRAFHFRRDNPAMWRGEATFTRFQQDGADVLILKKHDTKSANTVAVIFSDKDVTIADREGIASVQVKAWQPEFVILND